MIRLTKLSNSLLTLTKSDANCKIYEKTNFDFYELIKKVSIPYQEIAEFEGKHFNIHGESFLLTGDIAKLQQVLIILFDNALKYTQPKDDITVRLIQTKNHAELLIVDTGIGISEERLKHIFERFYRDDLSRGVIAGSGLGLSIAKQIINEHNWTINVNHNTPKGIIISIKM